MTTRRSMGRRGSVMMEFVIALPVLLALVTGCIQFAHLVAARLVVHYAAYCAARAGLVTLCEDAPPDATYESGPRGQELPLPGFQSAFTGSGSIVILPPGM